MSILTGRSLSATGLAVAVLLALVPTGHVAAQTAPSYESLLSRLNQMPATVQGVALAEAAERGYNRLGHCPIRRSPSKRRTPTALVPTKVSQTLTALSPSPSRWRFGVNEGPECAPRVRRLGLQACGVI